MSLRAPKPADLRSPVPLHPSVRTSTPAPRAARTGHRQNGMGDVVLPAPHGEIVALPRLWDFDLERVDAGEAVLRTDTGLIAVVTLLADTAVVADVADGDERHIA